MTFTIAGRVAALAVAGCLLGGCGAAATSATGQPDRVASLVTETPTQQARDAATPAPKKTGAESRRPQLRLDSTEEEVTKLRAALAACRTKHQQEGASAEQARKACVD